MDPSKMARCNRLQSLSDRLALFKWTNSYPKSILKCICGILATSKLLAIHTQEFSGERRERAFRLRNSLNLIQTLNFRVRGQTLSLPIVSSLLFDTQWLVHCERVSSVNSLTSNWPSELATHSTLDFRVCTQCTKIAQWALSRSELSSTELASGDKGVWLSPGMRSARRFGFNQTRTCRNSVRIRAAKFAYLRHPDSAAVNCLTNCPAGSVRPSVRLSVRVD